VNGKTGDVNRRMGAVKIVEPLFAAALLMEPSLFVEVVETANPGSSQP
jgi:hypothetical protein